jgi:hypothetical protein
MEVIELRNRRIALGGLETGSAVRRELGPVMNSLWQVTQCRLLKHQPSKVRRAGASQMLAIFGEQ